ncbi:NAD-dependent epimerase/dehydratase family protein [Pelagimonas sp. KU-00592-HH]|uniref:NAD-dependent epimerase/dehydratase family protein n=1 Tax=Pelagimonas sp. KU-00592-HH TaxID=3127651 RepID=UPI003102D56B
MKTALVLGAGGFIGGQMVNRLKSEGYWVRGVDLKTHEFQTTQADEFLLGDLTHQDFAAQAMDRDFDEIYQFAADMGGAGYIFTGDHDAAIMQNSAQINLNVLARAHHHRFGRIFYASSACIYPQENQEDPDNPVCSEHSAYPAHPDSEYGWEKLFSERLYLSAARQYGLTVRIARYHNIFGPNGTWEGGREKAPAALCRKVAETPDGGSIDVWGDGLQTRSFLYIDECIEATRRFTASDFEGPVNIGSDEMISINDLARMAIDLSGKSLTITNIPGPQGVRGRTSDNRLIHQELGWSPDAPLRDGMSRTYDWINTQVQNR